MKPIIMQNQDMISPEFAKFFGFKIAFATRKLQGRKPLMEKVRDTATALIDSTVRVIARDGLDKASIRTISSDCQIPNPYIYQHFKDKDDLFVSSFSREDSILASEFLSVFSSVHDAIKDTETRCRLICWLWNYMMEHQESIQFYVRYYYSTYYEQCSKAEHQERLPLAEAIRGCFEADANVQVLLQYILDNMMNMAMKVYSGELSDNDETRTHCFTLTLASIAPYLKKKEHRDAI